MRIGVNIIGYGWWWWCRVGSWISEISGI